jgi:hypothetical protein
VPGGRIRRRGGLGDRLLGGGLALTLCVSLLLLGQVALALCKRVVRLCHPSFLSAHPLNQGAVCARGAAGASKAMGERRQDRRAEDGG